jgi:hypothetical protein
MTDRKLPTAGFWITVALVAVLVGYPLSIGPACWISSRAQAGESLVSTVYRPLRWGMKQSEQIASAINWYSKLGSANDYSWFSENGWTWRSGRWIYPRRAQINPADLFTN